MCLARLRPSAARLRASRAPLLASVALLLCAWATPADLAAQEDPPDPPQPFTFRGEVRDFINDRPIKEAIVQIAELNRSAVTDSNGYFEFSDLVPGRYTIVTGSFGYETNRESSQIPYMAIMVVRIQPLAVALPGIEVSVERLVHQLEVRRLSLPVASTTFKPEVLHATNAPDVASFIRARTPVYILEDPNLQHLVYRFRGEIRRLRVCLDEVAVSSRFLEVMGPRDLARVELYQSLGMIRMYTRDFLDRAAEKGFSPTQIVLQGRGC